MTETISVPHAIELYLVRALAQARGPLEEIRQFVVGGFPPGGWSVPQDRYPYVEVFCGNQVEEGTLTGNYFADLYAGDASVFVSLAGKGQPGPDWLTVVGERIVELASYREVSRYVHAVIAELRRCTHRDLGEMVLFGDSVAVVEFNVKEPSYGFEPNARTNTWTNFGSVSFEVATEGRH